VKTASGVLITVGIDERWSVPSPGLFKATRFTTVRFKSSAWLSVWLHGLCRNAYQARSREGGVLPARLFEPTNNLGSDLRVQSSSALLGSVETRMSPLPGPSGRVSGAARTNIGCGTDRAKCSSDRETPTANPDHVSGPDSAAAHATWRWRPTIQSAFPCDTRTNSRGFAEAFGHASAAPSRMVDRGGARWPPPKGVGVK
jgi:hypothetical protein